jgi:hypothetical protein
MSEIDLIPQDYYNRLRMLRLMKCFMVATIGLVLATASIYGTLEYLIDRNHQVIASLEQKKAAANLQRAELNDLLARSRSLTDRLDVLERLRGGAAAQDMFVAVDRALDGETVWFTHWSFRRAGKAAPQTPKSVNTGYFIVIPSGQGPGAAPAWQIATHMEIRGQAVDHAALSNFVRRLLNQPQIADVRVLSTHKRKYGLGSVVEYSLAVTINSNRVNT